MEEKNSGAECKSHSTRSAKRIQRTCAKKRIRKTGFKAQKNGYCESTAATLNGRNNCSWIFFHFFKIVQQGKIKRVFGIFGEKKRGNHLEPVWPGKPVPSAFFG